MALRNFWVEVKIDGRKYKLAGGPRSVDGCMSIQLYMRNRGESMKAYEIRAFPCDETLHVTVDEISPEGKWVEVSHVTTER